MPEACIHNCYQDRDPGLTHVSSRLVLKAAIYHGPGHQETQWIRAGTDSAGKWDVLWMRSDWVEETTPLAWVAKGVLRGRELHQALLRAWFQGAKQSEDADEPPYGEPLPASNTLLTEEEVAAIADQVWGDE